MYSSCEAKGQLLYQEPRCVGDYTSTSKVPYIGPGKLRLKARPDAPRLSSRDRRMEFPAHHSP